MERARKATGKTNPYVAEVLEHAFRLARAVVVLSTPDDEAQLRPGLRTDGDREHEKVLTPQARANVIFEAGMAMGYMPSRTVLVEIGTLRPYSDIGGMHVVRISGAVDQLKEIAERLKTAKCDVDTDGTDWLATEEFQAVLKGLSSLGPDGTSSSTDDADDERRAIHAIREELETITFRVQRVARNKQYPLRLTLPADAFHKHKDLLRSDVRTTVGTAYVMADDVETVANAGMGPSPVGEHDGVDGLLSRPLLAKGALEKRLGELNSA